MRKTSAIAAALGERNEGRGPAVQAGPAAHGMPRRGPHGQAVPMAPADRIDGNFPAGVYDQSMTQMAPFLGGHQLPTGQTINVSMNAANPHLSFKEWAARGVVSGLGKAAAWPFKLCAGIVEDIARAIVSLLGKLVLFVLLPTALILGYKMAMNVTKADSVEQGATQIMHHGRHAADGIVRGMTDELPPETREGTKRKGSDAVKDER
jgi:hypothetical protein